jgi:multiple sugar transport system permease protein
MRPAVALEWIGVEELLAVGGNGSGDRVVEGALHDVRVARLPGELEHAVRTEHEPDRRTALRVRVAIWQVEVRTLKYTAIITPILIVGGYAVALLTAQNTPLNRLTRTLVFMPVVIGLGASSLLWYWLYSPRYGLIDKLLQDLGIIEQPILWLGVDEGLSTWAIVFSVVWKVLGFGVILFVAAIQAIPSEVNEASMVDGASFWQRVLRVTLPLTLPTVLLVTLISVIGSLLAFDQFFLMTAGQPRNLTATAVFYVYLNLFPYLKLGYGAALSLIVAVLILVFTAAQVIVTNRTRM